MNGLKLGNRNRKSKFSSLTVVNMVGGFAPVMDKDGNLTGYRWNVVTKVSMGSKANFRTGFVNVTEDEHAAIYKTLKLTEGDLQEGNEGYQKLVDAEGNPAPRKQSLLDGLTLGEYKFNSKEGVQIRVFSDIYAGVENAMYDSAKHGCTMIKNEAATKKGIRCFVTASGEIKPIYVENRPFWTTQKDRDGKIVADTTMQEALEMLNESSDEVWTYDKDTYLNPYDLVEFYEANDIVCTQLSNKIKSGKVFTELDESGQGVDLSSFDVSSLDSVQACKLFALENAETLGAITFGNSGLAKCQEKINTAIKAALMA